jgi:hypothetical protein
MATGMSSFAEMRFLIQKNHLIGPNIFWFEIGRYGVQKSEILR